MLLSLSACATHTSLQRPNADVFLQPTVIEYRYKTLEEIMADPASVTRDVFDFAGAAQDANDRCNADKASALEVLK